MVGRKSNLPLSTKPSAVPPGPFSSKRKFELLTEKQERSAVRKITKKRLDGVAQEQQGKERLDQQDYGKSKFLPETVSRKMLFNSKCYYVESGTILF